MYSTFFHLLLATEIRLFIWELDQCVSFITYSKLQTGIMY